MLEKGNQTYYLSFEKLFLVLHTYSKIIQWYENPPRAKIRPIVLFEFLVFLCSMANVWKLNILTAKNDWVKYESFPLWIFDERRKNIFHLRVYSIFSDTCVTYVILHTIFDKNQFHNKLVLFGCNSSSLKNFFFSFLDTFHIKNLPGRHFINTQKHG